MRDATVRLGEHDWEVRFVPRSRLKRDRVAECCWEKKRIRVLKTLPKDKLLDCLIHEFLHGTSDILYEAESFWIHGYGLQIVRRGFGHLNLQIPVIDGKSYLSPLLDAGKA